MTNDGTETRRSETKTANRLAWLVFAAAALGIFLLGLLAASILQRRAERNIARVQILKPVAEWEADNSKWGVNFPREYNSWELTKTMNENTKYGGSSHRDILAGDPRLVVMWAGYPFALDYNQARGHYHSLEDVNATKRTNEKTPATCWHCKSPDVPRVIDRDGLATFYSRKFAYYKDEIKNPIGCADCHNPSTMALRISRPALKEAFKRMGKDVTRASHQEMRTLVCAQCHVEYYFKDKKSNYLTFPWDEGLTAEAFEKYYKKIGFRDWTHAISGARMIKMQHPDYEIYSQGIHSFREVACADCHMPYKSEGGIKFTDHQIRSPLYNVASSCQVCHRWSEEDVWNRVTSIQDKHAELLATAQDVITRAHLEIGDAMKRGATDAELERPRELVSQAQMYWDYVAANNGMGFHAPQECARVLAKASNRAQECRLAVAGIRARRGGLQPVPLPDISTKQKAQAFVKPYVDEQKMREQHIEEKAVSREQAAR